MSEFLEGIFEGINLRMSQIMANFTSKSIYFKKLNEIKRKMAKKDSPEKNFSVGVGTGYYLTRTMEAVAAVYGTYKTLEYFVRQ